MDKKLKTKWLEALRSGEYEQGIEDLKFVGTAGTLYCCLGVLCEITNKKSSHPYYLDRALLKEFKLEDDAQICLAAMNDGGQLLSSSGVEYTFTVKSFKQIANWIEAHL